MWLGIRRDHLWAVCPDVVWAPSYTATLARGGGRCLSVAGDKLLVHGGELVTQRTDENLQLTQIVIV